MPDGKREYIETHPEAEKFANQKVPCKLQDARKLIKRIVPPTVLPPSDSVSIAGSIYELTSVIIGLLRECVL